jgi:hypothetical protein
MTISAVVKMVELYGGLGKWPPAIVPFEFATEMCM